MKTYFYYGVGNKVCKISTVIDGMYITDVEDEKEAIEQLRSDLMKKHDLINFLFKSYNRLK